MGRSNAFTIQFSGLKLGKHKFDFSVDDTFFEKLEYSQVKTGEIEVELELEKRSTMLTLDFKLNGWVGEECDRCMIDYKQKLTGEHRIFVNFGDEYDELDESLLVIPRDSYELNVSQLIYEFIGVNIPLRKVPCEENDDRSICDQKALNVLAASTADENSDNPLWVKLNEIKDQLKE
jgi:uncharacterized protein